MVQNEDWRGTEATERVSVFLVQAFDVLGDGRQENGAGGGMERKKEKGRCCGVGVCRGVDGGFISRQRGVSLPNKLAPAIEKSAR